MKDAIKAAFTSNSFNTFDEDPDFNVADALLWIAIGLHKVAEALNKANELAGKTKDITGASKLRPKQKSVRRESVHPGGNQRQHADRW